MYCSKLTKEMLLNWGFTKIERLADNNWYIERKWRKNNNKELTTKRITITKAKCKHKYSADKEYQKITFTHNRKGITITLARLIYVWFIGDLEQGEVVDHINNDSFDNRVENLQKLSIGENLAKRNTDNYKYAKNQYTVDVAQIAHKAFTSGKTYEEAIDMITEFLEHKRRGKLKTQNEIQ